MTRLKLRERPSAHKAAVVRENGKKGGRPAGSKDNLAGREELRAAAPAMAAELIRLALHGKTEQIRAAAIRDGLAYAWGMPPQPYAGDGQGAPIRFQAPMTEREIIIDFVPRAQFLPFTNANSVGHVSSVTEDAERPSRH